ncbi:MAG: metallophosphoesterase family protein [Desulfobacterales bacterium]|nr:metallophosphoesterase family protein [Desulfobacterales bacterium]
MRIYAVADIHGKSRRLDRIRKNIESYTPDLLVAAGDMTKYFNPDPAIAELNRLPVPVLALRGNSDRKRVEHLINGSTNIGSLHLQRHEKDGICLAGIGGTIPIPFRTRVAFKEKPLVRRLSEIAQNADVLVAHPPPYGFVDLVAGRAHAGWKRLTVLMAELEPALIICGHIHESAGFAWTGRTMVVNCAMGSGRGGAVIDLEKGDTPEVRMI